MNEMKVNACPQGYALEQAQNTHTIQPGLLEDVEDKDGQTIQEMIKESREKAERHREQLERIKSKPRYGDAPLEAYARLARARNKSQVGLAAGYARGKIAQLRAALRTDAENSEEIKAALRQLEKAVTRAGKKRQDLQKEEVKEKRRDRLMEEKERQRAQRLNQDLRRAKLLRSIRERGYMHEAVIDGQQQKMLSATRNELRQQAQALQAAMTPSVEYAAQQYAAGAAVEIPGGEAAAPVAPAVDVQA